MNILGWEINRATRISAAGSAFAERTHLAAVAAAQPDAAPKITRELAAMPYVKSTFEIPMGFPSPMSRNRQIRQELNTRNIPADPLSDWALFLPDKIPAKQISSILRQALAGNLWQQANLSRLMADSWPQFAKCCFELRAAISSAKYVVHPYCEKGKDASPSAIDKADTVRLALDAGFDPDRFADEDGLHGMIFDLTDAIINGYSIVELLWNDDETMVRGSAWVNPRNYSFTRDGRIGVAMSIDSGDIAFNSTAPQRLNDQENKFLVAKFKSKSGSALGAGWMRKLAQYWMITMYCRDYANLFAQKYGSPFMDIMYEGDMNDQHMQDQFERLAQLAAAQNYFIHPKGSELKIYPANQMSVDNAQLAMMKLADQQCRELMLGQSLTTTVGDSGSRALGDVHNDVRTERIEEHCKWIARILTEQFATSILKVNYGRDYDKNPERPTIEVDLTRPLSATERADFLQKLSTTTVPLDVEETCKSAGIKVPELGDKVFIRGEMVIMEEAMSATEKRQKVFDEQLDQQLEVNQAMGEPSANPAEAAHAVEAASAEDRQELEMLVAAAEASPVHNGEAVRVKHKLQQILTKSRR